MALSASKNGCEDSTVSPAERNYRELCPDLSCLSGPEAMLNPLPGR